MKKIILIITLLIGIIGTSFGQKRATYYQVINKEVKGKLVEYISEQGEVFMVGDTIEIGRSLGEDFQFIKQMAGSGLLGVYPVVSGAQGSMVRVKKITASQRKLWVVTTHGNQVAYAMYIDLENALDSGEVVSKIMSREEAIANLMESKNLLDLGMMTQSEYDKIKIELTPIIKGEK